MHWIIIAAGATQPGVPVEHVLLACVAKHAGMRKVYRNKISKP